MKKLGILKTFFVSSGIALLAGCCTTGYAPAPNHRCMVPQQRCHSYQYQPQRFQRVRSSCEYNNGCNRQGCPSQHWDSLRTPHNCFY